MAEKRKLRKSGDVMIITLPVQVCRLYGWKNGDIMEIEPIGPNELRLRKVD